MRGQKPVQQAEALLLDKVLPLVKVFDVAIDVGAHVGSWTVRMAEHFKLVYAYEPGHIAFEDLLFNTEPLTNVKAVQAGIGEHYGKCISAPPRKWKTTTGWLVTPDAGDLPMFALDDLFFTHKVGLIKIDVEGCEPLVIKGAERLLWEQRPVVVLELNNMSGRFGYSDEQVAGLLLAHSYREVFSSHVDHVFVPKEFA